MIVQHFNDLDEILCYKDFLLCNTLRKLVSIYPDVGKIYFALIIALIHFPIYT
jgi:hypothetical protein